jgi:hypothetical protein
MASLIGVIYVEKVHAKYNLSPGMKNFVISCLWGFFIMFLVSYIMGVNDGAFKDLYYSESWLLTIVGSLKYWVLWVLPYWWAVIIAGSLLFGVLVLSVRKLIALFK